MTPECGCADILQLTLAATVPSGHRQAAPACAGIGQSFGQGRLTTSDHTGSSDGAALSWSGRVEQPRVQPQTRNHANVSSDRSQQVDGGVAAVGDGNNLAVGKPADSCRSRPPKRDDAARCNGLMPPGITR